MGFASDIAAAEGGLPLASGGGFRDMTRIAGSSPDLWLDIVRENRSAVLALLHRQHCIRFEPTRTNGEYVRQVHLSERAPLELHEPFQRLTNLFETAWYGDRPCDAGDYRACRALAEEVYQEKT